ncbi:MAG: hypothetical protein K2G23_02325 [Muribaculaceae bacterium]|nr:hypothetical protein [Muribaculaceae bacterium]
MTGEQEGQESQHRWIICGMGIINGEGACSFRKRHGGSMPPRRFWVQYREV